MCLGIPAQIVDIPDPSRAKVAISGVERMIATDLLLDEALAAGTRGPSNGHVGLFGPGAAGAEETRPAAEMGGPRDGGPPRHAEFAPGHRSLVGRR